MRTLEHHVGTEHVLAPTEHRDALVPDRMVEQEHRARPMDAGTEAESRFQSSDARARSSTMTRVLLRTSGTTVGPKKVLMGASVNPMFSANAMSPVHSSRVKAPRIVMMWCF